MRLGLAGTGRIGAFHAATLCSLDEVDELVVTDVDAARAGTLAAQLGVTAVPDVAALLESGVDGLVVAAATDAHPALIEAGVSAGVPVFCEKPVAPTVAATLPIVELVAASGVPVQIGFQRRFDAGYRMAREAIAAGKLGWVHTLRATTLDAAPPPAEYVPHSGGLFRDCGVHDFDVIRWVTGHEVVEVYAVGTNRGEEFFVAAGDVDTASAVLTLDDDTLAVVSETRYNAAGYDVRLEVLGSADSIAVGLDDRLPLRSAEAGVAFPAGTPYPMFLDRFEPAYREELRTFVDVVAGRAASPCTVRDALESAYVAEACELSRTEHRPVRIEEVR
jgi:myo-inositol 2-dehydrogenase/D-chiro-inositol 1-dehydrogenase